MNNITNNEYDVIKAVAEDVFQYYKTEKGMLFFVILVSENKNKKSIKYALVPRDLELIQKPYKVTNKFFIKEFEDMLSGIDSTNEVIFINHVIYIISNMLKKLKVNNENNTKKNK